MTNLKLDSVVLVLGTLLLCTGTLAEPLEKCQPRNETYKIGDNQQCDKYYQCFASGQVAESLCEDGFVFSVDYRVCDYPHNVNCRARPILQSTPSKNPFCPRMNGFYPFPAEESCQKFYHCLEGAPYEKTCPAGVIFDDSRGACVHPDMAGRKECSATKVLNFKCPNSGNKFAKLRFGNHDRHSHPEDCQLFFTCGVDGEPRLAGCSVGKVFNPKTGKCSPPNSVPHCVDWYKLKTEEELRLMDSDPDNDGDSDEEASNSATAPDVPVKQAPPSGRPAKQPTRQPSSSILEYLVATTPKPQPTRVPVQVVPSKSVATLPPFLQQVVNVNNPGN